MSEHAEQHYTDPKLRERLKDQIERGSKGGRAGQWSARKSQLLVKAYEEAGGGYVGEKSEAARSLTRWTKEDWQTTEGGDAEHGHHMHRYLPKEVWNCLSPAEQQEAEAAKDRAKGQRVAWPEAVKREMKRLRAEEKNSGHGAAKDTKADLYAQAKALNVKGRSRMTSAELQRAVAAAR